MRPSDPPPGARYPLSGSGRANPRGQLSRGRFAAAFTGLILGLLLSSMDTTIVGAAQPRLVGDLGGLAYLPWVITVYLLTATTTMPLYGKLADALDRKRLFQAALAIFTAASVLAAASQTMRQLIAARFVQGVGAGGLVTLPRMIASDLVDPVHRARYQAYLGALAGLAAASGPLVGGVIVDNLSWRWTFLVNIPLCLLAVALVQTQLPARLGSRRDRARIDGTGLVLLLAAAGGLLVVALLGGRQLNWGDPRLLAMAAASLLATAGLVWVERRVTSPLLPIDLLRFRNFWVVSAVSVTMGPTMYGVLTFTPAFLQIVHGESATRAGILMTPLMMGGVLSTVAIGIILRSERSLRPLAIPGAAAMACGIAGLAAVRATTPSTAAALALSVAGFGLGLLVPTIIVTIQNAVPPGDLGRATATIYFTRTLGGAIGVAAAGALFTARTTAHLRSAADTTLPPGLDPATLLEEPGALRTMGSTVAALLRTAVGTGMTSVFVALTAIALATVSLTVLLREEQQPTS